MLLTGNRIRLREYRDEDRAVHASLERDVATGIGHRAGPRYPMDDHELDGLVERRRTVDGERYLFTVATRDSDAAVGRVSIRDLNPVHRRALLGVALVGAARGQRLGAEAVAVACDWAFDELGLHRLEAEVDADNPRSLATFQRCGFVEEVRRPRNRFHGGSFHDVVVLGLLEDEWRSRRAEVMASLPEPDAEEVRW